MTDTAVCPSAEVDKAAISSHYDLPPAFFASFLGPRMAYSCAYFRTPETPLARAEEDKLALTAEKLRLQPGDRVLDVGCGWGSFIDFAEERYGAECVGITLAEEQARTVNARAASRRAADRVRADVVHAYDMDYGAGSFDKIVTIGAIEHMEDLGRVFGNCARMLTDDGLMLVHGMTQPWRYREKLLRGEKDEVEELLEQHFGIGHWHSLWEVTEDLEKSGFEILDVENISQHYKLTVERWLENLIASEDRIVGGGILPEEKYREFVAFFAAYIVSFEMSETICNQILVRKTLEDRLRPPYPLTRDRMVLRPASAASREARP
jgi:cyclopropane-fatty-acyl-phospholipid synthase